ncbi:WhiB family transcriptional regulator [Rhodococcus baikonurensis]|uniref:WhiB family transcriptional regulator n=1 Tax=Rhodococcus baikonurensis TaxID=172041 RepID=UPI00378F30A9
MDSAEAPCRFSDPDLWLSSIRSELSTAIALCRKRSRFHQCLTGALDRQEVAGIWGGRHIVGGELRPFRGRRAATPPDDSGFMPLRKHLRASGPRAASL